MVRSAGIAPWRYLLPVLLGSLFFALPTPSRAASPSPLKALYENLTTKLRQVDATYRRKDADLLHAYQRAMAELNRERLPAGESDRKSKEIHRRYQKQKRALHAAWEKERRHWLQEMKRLSRAEAEAGNRIKQKIRELNEEEQKEIKRVLKSYEPRRKRALEARDQKELMRIIAEQSRAVNDIDRRYKREIAVLQSRGKREEMAVAIFRQGISEMAGYPRLRAGVVVGPKIEARRGERPAPTMAEVIPGKARIAIPRRRHPPLIAAKRPSEKQEGKSPGHEREHVKGVQPGTVQAAPTVHIRDARPRPGSQAGGESAGERPPARPTQKTRSPGPQSIVTEVLVMTGLGRREIEAEAMRMTGLGRREIQTESLKMTGLGRREVLTEALAMTGLGSRGVVTAPLRMSGLGLEGHSR